MPKVTQEQAINEMLGYGNCFLTGGAGVGKSFIINKLMDEFISNDIPYALTASTGIAAQLIGGTTIHSFAGLGIKDSLEEVTKHAYFWRKVVPVLKDIEVLIIDEISMLGSKLMSLLDVVMQTARSNKKPYGGCKLIIVGDPFQLPPVNDDYFFVSESYWNAKFKILNLTKNYRATNLEWNDILRKIRVGVIDSEVMEMFYRRCKAKPPKDITRIVSTNAEADRININKLSTINSEERKYYYRVKDPQGVLGPRNSKQYRKSINDFFKNRLIKRELFLKVGAWVMIIVNDNKNFEYVNGTCGEITYMCDDGVIVETKKKKLDSDGNIVLDSKGFAVMIPDQQLEISSKHPFKIEKTIKNPNYGDTYKDENGREVFDDRETITSEAIIYNLPIILAFGTTCHKSQGQTLCNARINLINGFTDGQAYVALSRVKTEEGVYLDNIPSDASLEVNQDVIDFVQFNIKDFSNTMKESVLNKIKGE